MATKYYLDWQEVNTNWEDLGINWEDVFILIEAKQKAGGGSGNGLKEYIDGNPWAKFKRDLGEEKLERLNEPFFRPSKYNLIANDLSDLSKSVSNKLKSSSNKLKSSEFEFSFN